MKLGTYHIMYEYRMFQIVPADGADDTTTVSLIQFLCMATMYFY